VTDADSALAELRQSLGQSAIANYLHSNSAVVGYDMRQVRRVSAGLSHVLQVRIRVPSRSGRLDDLSMRAMSSRADA
jgi:hypothetical protein